MYHQWHHYVRRVPPPSREQVERDLLHELYVVSGVGVLRDLVLCLWLTYATSLTFRRALPALLSAQGPVVSTPLSLQLLSPPGLGQANTSYVQSVGPQMESPHAVSAQQAMPGPAMRPARAARSPDFRGSASTHPQRSQPANQVSFSIRTEEKRASQPQGLRMLNAVEPVSPFAQPAHHPKQQTKHSTAQSRHRPAQQPIEALWEAASSSSRSGSGSCSRPKPHNKRKLVQSVMPGMENEPRRCPPGRDTGQIVFSARNLPRKKKKKKTAAVETDVVGDNARRTPTTPNQPTELTWFPPAQPMEVDPAHSLDATPSSPTPTLSTPPMSPIEVSSLKRKTSSTNTLHLSAMGKSTSKAKGKGSRSPSKKAKVSWTAAAFRHTLLSNVERHTVQLDNNAAIQQFQECSETANQVCIAFLRSDGSTTMQPVHSLVKRAFKKEDAQVTPVSILFAFASSATAAMPPFCWRLDSRARRNAIGMWDEPIFSMFAAMLRSVCLIKLFFDAKSTLVTVLKHMKMSSFPAGTFPPRSCFDVHLGAWCCDPDGHDSSLDFLAVRERYRERMGSVAAEGLSLDLRVGVSDGSGDAEDSNDEQPLLLPHGRCRWCATAASSTDTLRAFSGPSSPDPDPGDCVVQLLRDVCDLPRLAAVLYEDLRECELLHPFVVQEMPVCVLLAEMEAVGVGFEADALRNTNSFLIERLSEAERAAVQSVPGAQPFSITSPQQVAAVLYDHLRLSAPSRAKSRRSTEEAVLKELSKHTSLAVHILRFRKIHKLLSTYVEPFLEFGARVHCQWHQACTGTGRLSSSAPNMQNLPRTATGDLEDEDAELAQAVSSIRAAFRPAGDGRVFVSADYQQMELRLMAHLAGDTHLIQVLSDRTIDVYCAVAARVFRAGATDQVTPAQRQHAKVVVLSVMYGSGSYRIAEQLGITGEEAKKLMRDFLNAFPGLRLHMERVKASVRRIGWVTTVVGRKRYFPDINSSTPEKRAAAERQAVNAEVQGGAADMMKAAMLKLRLEFERLGLPSSDSRVVLQIHDELVVEVRQALELQVASLLRDCMANALPESRVPFPVTVKHGSNLADLTELDEQPPRLPINTPNPGPVAPHTQPTL